MGIADNGANVPTNFRLRIHSEILSRDKEMDSVTSWSTLESFNPLTEWIVEFYRRSWWFSTSINVSFHICGCEVEMQRVFGDLIPLIFLGICFSITPSWAERAAFPVSRVWIVPIPFCISEGYMMRDWFFSWQCLLCCTEKNRKLCNFLILKLQVFLSGGPKYATRTTAICTIWWWWLILLLFWCLSWFWIALNKI